MQAPPSPSLSNAPPADLEIAPSGNDWRFRKTLASSLADFSGWILNYWRIETFDMRATFEMHTPGGDRRAFVTYDSALAAKVIEFGTSIEQVIHNGEVIHQTRIFNYRVFP